MEGNNHSLPPAIFLMGPTAIGKTDFAKKISDNWPVEIISVDSAMIYKGMDIGTAKPNNEFLKKIPHHLINLRNPDQIYTVADFRKDALLIMKKITERGNLPLLVGGTMLYFKILLDGIADLPNIDQDIRQNILSEADKYGWPKLHERLRKIDPESAGNFHPNHSRRIQRALEVFYSTGETLSSYHARQSIEALPYHVSQFTLWPTERKNLHSQIEIRFKNMLNEGLVDELKQLRKVYNLHEDLPSMRSVGYKQCWDFLEGRIDNSQLLLKGVFATRKLAKKQLTWLRNWSNLSYLNVEIDRTASMNINLAKISTVIEDLLT